MKFISTSTHENDTFKELLARIQNCLECTPFFKAIINEKLLMSYCQTKYLVVDIPKVTLENPK